MMTSQGSTELANQEGGCMRQRRITVLVGVLLILLFGGAIADTLSVSVGSASYITGQIDGRSCGRLLIKPTIPDRVLRSRIDFALLTLPGLQLPDSLGAMIIDLRRVTTPWNSGSATWTTPWRNPGGDWDSTQQFLWSLVPGDTLPIRIDLTSCIRAWQAGDNDGLILKRPHHEGGGFRGEGVLLRQAIASARLKLYFTRLRE
jgi:hypothetical protein